MFLYTDDVIIYPFRFGSCISYHFFLFFHHFPSCYPQWCSECHWARELKQHMDLFTFACVWDLLWSLRFFFSHINAVEISIFGVPLIISSFFLHSPMTVSVLIFFFFMPGTRWGKSRNLAFVCLHLGAHSQHLCLAQDLIYRKSLLFAILSHGSLFSLVILFLRPLLGRFESFAWVVRLKT